MNRITKILISALVLAV
jgi:hypothetical protein